MSAIGKKRGRKKLAKKRISRTITIDADLPAAVAQVSENLSGFLNDAGWKEVKRAMRLGPKLGPNGGKMGKK